MKAIDIHAHFGHYDRGGGGLLDRCYSGGIDVVRRRAVGADICLTVVSAYRALFPYGGDVLRGNEEALEMSERHADIGFWAVLNPRLEETYENVETLLKHPKCKGIKIHPFEHGYEIRDHGGEVFRFASQRGAVVLAHSGHPGSFPEDFVPFANRHADMILVLAHLGNSTDDGYLSRQVYAVKFAHAHNVYVDTSSAASIKSGLIEWAVAEIGASRLLFGTDSPIYFTASQKARIEHAEIDEEAKRAILFENAARLLRCEQVLDVP